MVNFGQQMAPTGRSIQRQPYRNQVSVKQNIVHYVGGDSKYGSRNIYNKKPYPISDNKNQ